MTTREHKGKTKNWDKLFDFMDKNNFTCLDFMICICAQLLHSPENEFKAEIKIQDSKFEVEIRKDVNQ